MSPPFYCSNGLCFKDYGFFGNSQPQSLKIRNLEEYAILSDDENGLLNVGGEDVYNDFLFLIEGDVEPLPPALPLNVGLTEEENNELEATMCFDDEGELLNVGSGDFFNNFQLLLEGDVEPLPPRLPLNADKHFTEEEDASVTDKNSSRKSAPENPIKAIHRIKTSPLTAEEIEHIYEGIKNFNNDCTSIWDFAVPERDPSLLPRQWRTAIGTQKSYRRSREAKEKRRVYEAKRRKVKASCQTLSRKEVNHDMVNENEAYVPEALSTDIDPKNLHDDSIPELVIEHEDLSESDDEIECLEFECEELDDSEDL